MYTCIYLQINQNWLTKLFISNESNQPRKRCPCQQKRNTLSIQNKVLRDQSYHIIIFSSCNWHVPKTHRTNRMCAVKPVLNIVSRMFIWAISLRYITFTQTHDSLFRTWFLFIVCLPFRLPFRFHVCCKTRKHRWDLHTASLPRQDCWGPKAWRAVMVGKSQTSCLANSMHYELDIIQYHQCILAHSFFPADN